MYRLGCRSRRFVIGAVALLVTGLTPASPVRADAVVGTGTAASCTEAALALALSAGGSVTFNCGPAPVTIVLTSSHAVVGTTLDGGNRITISACPMCAAVSLTTSGSAGFAHLVLDAAVTNNGVLNVDDATLTHTVTNQSTGTFTVTHSDVDSIQNNGGLVGVSYSSVKPATTGVWAIISQYNGSVTVSDSTLSGGDVQNFGAVSNLSGSFSLTRSTVSGNIGPAVFNADQSCSFSGAATARSPSPTVPSPGIRVMASRTSTVSVCTTVK